MTQTTMFWVVDDDGKIMSPTYTLMTEAQEMANALVLDTGRTYHIMSAQRIGTVVIPLAHSMGQSA